MLRNHNFDPCLTWGSFFLDDPTAHFETFPKHHQATNPLLPIKFSCFKISLRRGVGELEFSSKLEIWIQISAPLIAFGVKTTVRAVLAHEFLHYVELSRRFMEFDISSNEMHTSLLEASHRDQESLIPPARIFSDKKLIKYIQKDIETLEHYYE